MSVKVSRIEVPTPYLVGPVNIHLLLGDAAVLVDTGPRTPEGEEILAAGLRKEGVSFKDIDAILITHAHLDHFGMAAHLKDRSGAKVFAHENDRVFLEDYPSSHHRIVERLREHSLRHGFPAAQFAAVTAYYNGSLGIGSPVEVDRTYREGRALEFGSIRLEPVHTPGHTGGSTCFYESKSRRLFTGDTVLEHITPVSFFRGRRAGVGLATYLESLEKLRKLAVRRVHPGHRGGFAGFRDALDRIARHIDLRRKRVLEAFSSGERHAYDVSRSVFGEGTGTQRWLAFAETLGMLEALAGEGRVREVADDGLSRFVRMR